MWEDSENIQHIIYLGALAAAITAIYTLYKWLWPKLKCIYEKIEWFMSDENDHVIIMQRLDEISEKLKPNGQTEQLRRIEHAVMFQNARTQASLHMNPNPVFETNEKGHVTFVNTGYKSFFGIDRNDAYGMGWVNIIESKERKEVVDKWFQAVNDKRAFDEYMTLVKGNGTPVKVHVIAYVIRGEHTEILGHHGEITFLDVEK